LNLAKLNCGDRAGLFLSQVAAGIFALPANSLILLERFLKEAIHELGHTLALAPV
jgi:predicted Zn-dependent protease